MFLERYMSNLERLIQDLKMDVIRGTRPLAQSLKFPWPFKNSLGENPEHVSRRKEQRVILWHRDAGAYFR
jgi:hypothetical protein